MEEDAEGHLKDFKRSILEIDKAKAKLASLPKNVWIEEPSTVEAEKAPDRPFTFVKHEWLD